MEKGIKGARCSRSVHLSDQALPLITTVQPVLLLNTVPNYLPRECTLYCKPMCLNASKYHNALTTGVRGCKPEGL